MRSSPDKLKTRTRLETEVTAMADQMTGEVALQQLGVSPDLLTDEEKRSLDENGFVILEDVLPPEQIEHIRKRLAAIEDQRQRSVRTDEGVRAQARRRLDHMTKLLKAMEAAASDADRYREFVEKTRESMAQLQSALDTDDIEALRKSIDIAGGYNSQFLEDLLDTDPAFDLSIGTPRVLAAVSYLIGPDFHAWGTYCRQPDVGEGHQPLHRDPGERGEMCGALWFIDDMTPDNGATRVVPGTHLSDLQPADELDGDATKTHPREVVLVGKAGTVVVFANRTWHGGTKRNERGGPRRLVISGYSRRSHFRDQPLHVGPQTAARLHPAQRWLLHLDDPKLSPGELAYAKSGPESEQQAAPAR